MMAKNEAFFVPGFRETAVKGTTKAPPRDWKGVEARWQEVAACANSSVKLRLPIHLLHCSFFVFVYLR